MGSSVVLPMAIGSVDRLEEIPERLRFLFEFDADGGAAQADVAEVLGGAGRARGRRALADELRGAGRSIATRSGRSASAGRQRTGQKGRALFHPIRVALTGEAGGPELDLAVPAIDRGAELAPAPGVARSSAAASARRRSRAAAEREAESSRRAPVRSSAVEPDHDRSTASTPCSRRCARGACARLRRRARRRTARRRRSSRCAQRAARRRRARGRRARSIRLARGGVHQGVVAEIAAARGLHASRSWSRAARRRRRCSSCSTASRIRRTSARSCGRRTPPVRTASSGRRGMRRRSTARAKASAGAVAHVRIADLVNIARALEELKDAGVWTVGLAGDAAERYDEVDLTLPTAVVVARKGRGCGGWCGSAAIGWCRFRWRGGREPECVGGGRGRAVRGGPAAAGRQAWRIEAGCSKRCRLALPQGHDACTRGTGRAINTRFVWLA